MRILVNSQEMKQCDTNTIDYYKVPSLVLMERAALGVMEEIKSRKIDDSRCLVVCGLGNNGGDGLAVARMLYQKGSDVTIVIDMKEEKASPQTKQQYEIIKQYQIPVVSQIPQGEYTLVIDAIFGIGLSRNIEGHFKKIIAQMNELSGFKLAIDIPSGISGDSGQVLGCAFLADLTVTFAYEKTGLVLYPGYEYAGTTVVKDIGIDEKSWRDSKPSVYAYEASDLQRLPERKKHSNKGTYGHVLVIAGQHNMAGAAFFSGKAALVTGCGLVKIMTVEENRTIIQQLLPEAILTTYQKGETKEDAFQKNLEECINWANVVVIGPGLGMDEDAQQLVSSVLKKAAVPLIIDADALNIIAKQPGLLKEIQGQAILTPHLGEMARLTECSISDIQNHTITVAGNFAKEYNVICVLKNDRTITADNDTWYINTSGNQGMAAAGAGDVLTGVIAGLIAQGLDAILAASLGVFLHGMAGDAMLPITGSYGMMATDIIEGIKRVTRKEI